jgi:hypothetical protein
MPHNTTVMIRERLKPLHDEDLFLREREREIKTPFGIKMIQ